MKGKNQDLERICGYFRFYLAVISFSLWMDILKISYMAVKAT